MHFTVREENLSRSSTGRRAKHTQPNVRRDK